MRVFLALLVVLISGCSTIDEEQSAKFTPEKPISNFLFDTVADTFESAVDTVKSPLVDVGISKKDIPQKLQITANNPYASLSSYKCKAIIAELTELDELLGPDPYGIVAGQEAPKKGQYLETGVSFAQNQAIGMVGSKVNFIPFRSVVRKISGADSHAKAVSRAYESGQLRRAFLKGVIQSNGKCAKEIKPSISEKRKDSV